MNCQEFKKTWLHETDSAALSHIETCDECIAWIEANFTSDEEVQFMKEYPQPSVQLEDRIMQAIYRTVEPAAPPLGAATAEMNRPLPKRWSIRYPVLAWASAAALVLAVVGYQQMIGTNAEKQAANLNIAAPEAGEAKQAENAPAASAATTAADPVSVGVVATTQAAPDSTQYAQVSATETSVESAMDKGKPEPAQQQTGPKTEPKPRQQTTQEVAPEPAPAVEAKTPAIQERPMIAARTAADKASPKSMEKANPPAAPQTPPPAVAGTAPEQPVNALAAAEVPLTTTAALTAPVAGPPNIAEAKEAITLSVFEDVQTAVQASDMPVPSAEKLPNGFALTAISLQYESETGKKVTKIAADYKRNADWIKIEVTRNEHGKRSLSIPGTFIDTQLFTIEGEHAIAVSYDPQAAHSETFVQHAVHFNTVKGNQSLYVVLTASGIRLDELIEVAKQTTWKTQ